MARDVASAAGVGIGEGAERRGPAGRGTVLVVDDDPIGLRLASLHLKLAGYTVLPCVGGQAALAAAADDHPDLILLDVRLPDLDGYEVCSRLKQNPATAGIPVVLLTALNDREDRLRALELGADDFLSKPYDQAELLARARSLVQQRRLHEQLTQSEARYRSLLANLPDVVWRLDRAGAYLFVSPTVERVCGLAAGELYTSGMDRWLGRVHHTDAKRVAAAYAGLLAGRAPLDVEYRFQRTDGTWIWLHDRSILASEPEAGYVDGISSDVSVRRRIEEERARLIREQAARAAAEATVRQLRAIQAVTDVALTHLTAADLLPELLGRLQALLQADIAVVMLVDEAGQSLVARAATGLEEKVTQRLRLPVGHGFAGRIAAERRPIEIDDVDNTNIRGPVVQALRARGVRSLLGVPLLLEGRVLGVLLVGTFVRRHYATADVELLQVVAGRIAVALDRARLYENERAAHDAAAAAVRERDEFLSVAAHELKTPITSLRAAAQLALRRLAGQAALDPAQAGRTFELVERQTGRLTHLVNQLLDVARIEAGKLALAPEPTDLGHLVKSVVPLVPTDPARHHIVVRTPAAPVLAVVDPLRLEQVLLNLLTNAVKYSLAGGAIELELDRPDSATVRLSVRDHGVGVPPERRAHLFERFYQAHGEGHLSGLGLGLYVSREIVALHGGLIAAEFPPDGGTRLVVTLPSGIEPAALPLPAAPAVLSRAAAVALFST